jgi:serine/threonine protein kinase
MLTTQKCFSKPRLFVSSDVHGGAIGAVREMIISGVVSMRSQHVSVFKEFGRVVPILSLQINNVTDGRKFLFLGDIIDRLNSYDTIIFSLFRAFEDWHTQHPGIECPLIVVIGNHDLMYPEYNDVFRTMLRRGYARMSYPIVYGSGPSRKVVMAKHTVYSKMQVLLVLDTLLKYKKLRGSYARLRLDNSELKFEDIPDTELKKLFKISTPEEVADCRAGYKALDFCFRNETSLHIVDEDPIDSKVLDDIIACIANGQIQKLIVGTGSINFEAACASLDLTPDEIIAALYNVTVTAFELTVDAGIENAPKGKCFFKDWLMNSGRGEGMDPTLWSDYQVGAINQKLATDILKKYQGNKPHITPVDELIKIVVQPFGSCIQGHQTLGALTGGTGNDSTMHIFQIYPDTSKFVFDVDCSRSASCDEDVPFICDPKDNSTSISIYQQNIRRESFIIANSVIVTLPLTLEIEAITDQDLGTALRTNYRIFADAPIVKFRKDTMKFKVQGPYLNSCTVLNLLPPKLETTRQIGVGKEKQLTISDSVHDEGFMLSSYDYFISNTKHQIETARTFSSSPSGNDFVLTMDQCADRRLFSIDSTYISCLNPEPRTPRVLVCTTDPTVSMQNLLTFFTMEFIRDNALLRKCDLPEHETFVSLCNENYFISQRHHRRAETIRGEKIDIDDYVEIVRYIIKFIKLDERQTQLHIDTWSTEYSYNVKDFSVDRETSRSIANLRLTTITCSDSTHFDINITDGNITGQEVIEGILTHWGKRAKNLDTFKGFLDKAAGMEIDVPALKLLGCDISVDDKVAASNRIDIKYAFNIITEYFNKVFRVSMPDLALGACDFFGRLKTGDRNFGLFQQPDAQLKFLPAPQLHMEIFQDKLFSITSDRFNIIGHGGYATVYRLKKGQTIHVTGLQESDSTELTLDDSYAIRVLDKVSELDISVARILKELNVRGVIKFFGCIRSMGDDKVIREYSFFKCADQDLLKYIFCEPIREEKAGALIVRTRPFLIDLNTFASIVLALRNIHRHGIIHRDIKPENFLVDVDKSKTIHHSMFFTDFGFALKQADNVIVEEQNSIYGTEVYIAPEYQTQKLCGRCSDIWSFGLTMIDVIAGTLILSDGTNDKEREYVPNFLQAMIELAGLQLQQGMNNRAIGAGVVHNEIVKAMQDPKTFGTMIDYLLEKLENVSPTYYALLNPCLIPDYTKRITAGKLFENTVELLITLPQRDDFATLATRPEFLNWNFNISKQILELRNLLNAKQKDKKVLQEQFEALYAACEGLDEAQKFILQDELDKLRNAIESLSVESVEQPAAEKAADDETVQEPPKEPTADGANHEPPEKIDGDERVEGSPEKPATAETEQKPGEAIQEPPKKPDGDEANQDPDVESRNSSAKPASTKEKQKPDKEGEGSSEKPADGASKDSSEKPVDDKAKQNLDEANQESHEKPTTD